jgi:hypothetical protein
MLSRISCPATGQVVSFKVMTDAKTVAASWKKFIRLQCPHCEDRHAIPFKQVYIDGVLTNFKADSNSMFQMSPDSMPPGMKQESA